ncbi:FxsA cytoplasmic membrane protein [Sulfuricurvum kujiense DSM 16994]|uniref:FxsA cytoplasmic membrane protein n=1 Tax=Sulfuricurvum kujiense (strain ATCC BAA-921 / DSM 16994 / JCM 11577 / YK-1) TaxID=709032 RepID=E4U287_SULKY|nr:FxsA family protein [Sulfuricurvum kujiense]ADR33537.1 FxsA cytoplasmic membrane protein [Sulfuricurvum kujiense DSM 16994]
MIYFLIYLFAEVTLTVEIASKIGGLATFLEILGSAFLGIFILMNFRHALSENLEALRTRQIDVQGFSNRNMTGLLGALLLILPGFLSDIIGILLQFSFIGTLIINRFTRKYQPPTQPKDDHVIDAEIIEHTTTLR